MTDDMLLFLRKVADDPVIQEWNTSTRKREGQERNQIHIGWVMAV
jgi:hypothetical protein